MSKRSQIGRKHLSIGTVVTFDKEVVRKRSTRNHGATSERRSSSPRSNFLRRSGELSWEELTSTGEK